MLTGQEFSVQALSSKYDNLKYGQYDCQAFVELVLKDCGVRNSNGVPYNWKGSNDMWRHALSWKGTLAECRNLYGRIPDGAWVFMVKHDGGEIPRGYHDDEGNASHVGIYCRPENTKSVRDSTKGTGRDGVGFRSVNDFTHVGLPKMISYGQEPAPVPQNSITKEKALEALETLTKYVKG